AARRRGHAARLPDAAERDLHRRLPRRPARRSLGAADRGGVPGRRHPLGSGPERAGRRFPARPAQHGRADLGRGRRLADAGPAPGLPGLLITGMDGPITGMTGPAGGTGPPSATLWRVTRTARLQWWRRP